MAGKGGLKMGTISVEEYRQIIDGLKRDESACYAELQVIRNAIIWAEAQLGEMEA